MVDAALQAEASAFAAERYGDTTVDGVVARIDADKALAARARTTRCSPA